MDLRVEDIIETLNKYRNHKKKSLLELKNSTEIKNTPHGTNSRLQKLEEWINNLKHRVMESN